MIIASAIRLKDGRVFVGKRHGDVFTNMVRIMDKVIKNSADLDLFITDNESGFVNDKLEFKTREEAYWEAKAGDQLLDPERIIKLNEGELNPNVAKLFDPPLTSHHPALTSEDIFA